MPGESMVPLLRLYLLLQCILIPSVYAYHQGGNDTNCWIGHEQNLKLPCLEFEVRFDERNLTAFAGEPIGLTATLSSAHRASSSEGNESSVETHDSHDPIDVVHANFHACLSYLGWCTPDVRNSPGLVSTTAEQILGSRRTFSDDLVLDTPGEWTIIAHFEFIDRNNERWSVATGFRLTLTRRATELKVATWATTIVIVFASLGIVISIALSVFIVHHRKHWVIAATSPKVALVMILGCTLAFAAALTFLPPTSDAQCQSRVWLTLGAFDLVFISLALKSWRVLKIFSKENAFKRRAITDAKLFVIGGSILLADGVFALIWTLVGGLHVMKVPSYLDPLTSYSVQCVGQGQLVFELVALLAHGIPLLWVAVAANRAGENLRERSAPMVSTTTSAQQQTRLLHFDESASVALTLLSLLFVSVFAVGMQYTVRDAPSTQTLMAAGGCVWSGLFTLGAMFVPRIKGFFKLEKDGVTVRPESMRSRLATSLTSRRALPTPTEAGPAPREEALELILS